MKFKILLLAAFAIFLFSCSTKSKIVSDDKPVPVKGNFVVKTTDSDIIKRGSYLFENNCGGCHSLPKPNEHTLEAWKPILDRMQIEAKISDQEKADIYFFISRSI